MATADKGQNKNAFLRELFQKNPEIKEAEATEAWQQAGNDGTISPSTFYAAKRASQGGESAPSAAPVKSKPKSPKSPKSRAASQPVVEARSESNGETAPRAAVRKAGERERVLDRVEDGIDDLIIELKQLGGLEEALESLRKVRRVVVRSHEG